MGIGFGASGNRTHNVRGDVEASKFFNSDSDDIGEINPSKGEHAMSDDACIIPAMKRAIEEVDRRRKIQIAYNKKEKITPKSIKKPVRTKLVQGLETEEEASGLNLKQKDIYNQMLSIDIDQLLPQDRTVLVKKLTKQMKEAAGNLNFELAIALRDKIKELKARVYDLLAMQKV